MTCHRSILTPISRDQHVLVSIQVKGKDRKELSKSSFALLTYYNTMPSSRQSSSSHCQGRPSPLLARVPCQLGYATYLDNNETKVFTHLDMATTNHRDVVPFNRVEYPSRNEVHCRVLSFYRQTLTTPSWTLEFTW